ncbi:MAG: STAS domain-containing protein [Actinomycetota bacterium]
MIDEAGTALERPSSFGFSVVHADGAVRVAVRGEIDIASSDELRNALLGLSEQGVRHVTVDLADLAFIDSTGLGALIRVLKHYREQGGDMKLANPTRPVAKVLEITSLDRLFEIE